MRATDKRICIGIVSKDRPELLEKIVGWTRKWYPTINIWVCATKKSDIPQGLEKIKGLHILYSAASIPIQRNIIIKNTQDIFEYVLFIDDDTLLHQDYIEKAMRFLDYNQNVVALSGFLLKDGTTLKEGEKILSEPVKNQLVNDRKGKNYFWDSGKNWVLHGCNMVIRTDIFKKEIFDEAFKEYALYEDVEFSLRAVSHGRVGHYDECLAVHLKARSGRFSASRMTYADIVNNYYILFQKKLIISKNYTWCFFRFFLRIIFYNTTNRFLKYLVHTQFREAGKVLVGFSFAVVDMISGKARPERVLRVPE
jgi:GT2 family glycosyltransferase